MEKSFHIRNYQRNEAIVCVMFFTLMLLGSVFLSRSCFRPDEQFVASLFLCSFWGTWLIASICSLVAACCSRLQVSEDSIVFRGVFAPRHVVLRDLQSLAWKHMPRSGAICLKDAADSIKIRLDNYETEQRLWLIRFLRERVPHDRQTNWDLFCHKVALPLTKRRDPTAIPIPDRNAGEVLITRRRWDQYFVTVIVLSAVGGTVAAWSFEFPTLLLAPVQLVPLWLILRLLTPRIGYISKSILATPGATSSLSFLFVWGLVAFLGILAWPRVSPMLPVPTAMAVLLLVGWFAFLLRWAQFEDKTSCQRDMVASAASVEDWNRMGGDFDS